MRACALHVYCRVSLEFPGLAFSSHSAKQSVSQSVNQSINRGFSFERNCAALVGK